MGSILAALSELQRAAVLGNARQGRGSGGASDARTVPSH